MPGASVNKTQLNPEDICVVLAGTTNRDWPIQSAASHRTGCSMTGPIRYRGTLMSLKRMGYGAMQLAGPQVWGPPRDVDAAATVLREAVVAGINHIDTSDFYGPHVTNQIIKQALHPYPDGLVIVTKVGARRPEDKSWVHALVPVVKSFNSGEFGYALKVHLMGRTCEG